MHETGGLVGGLAEEGGELAPVVLVAAAGGAEAGEEGGGLDEGVVCVEPAGWAGGVVEVGQHGAVHVLRDDGLHHAAVRGRRHGQQHRRSRHGARRRQHKPRHARYHKYATALALLSC